MADKSIIPLGKGVSVYLPGPSGSSNELLDSNECAYAIVTGSMPHLLYVKATNPGGANNWSFELRSEPVSSIRYYDADHDDYDPPRIADVEKKPVRQDIPNWEATAKVQWTENLREDLGPVYYQVPSRPTTTGMYWIRIRVKNKCTMTILEEIGTHIIPIAYHTTDPVDGLKIEQVQHSDIEFWPVPRHAVWGETMTLEDFSEFSPSLPPS